MTRVLAPSTHDLLSFRRRELNALLSHLDSPRYPPSAKLRAKRRLVWLRKEIKHLYSLLTAEIL